MVEPSINIPELLDGISAPDGWRVEFVEGEITVSPLPDGPHAVIAGAIQEEFTWHFRSLELSYQARMCFGFRGTASCSDLRRATTSSRTLRS